MKTPQYAVKAFALGYRVDNIDNNQWIAWQPSDGEYEDIGTVKTEEEAWRLCATHAGIDLGQDEQMTVNTDDVITIVSILYHLASLYTGSSYRVADLDVRMIDAAVQLVKRLEENR